MKTFKRGLPGCRLIVSTATYCRPELAGKSQLPLALLLVRNSNMQSRGCSDAVIPAPLNADEVIAWLLVCVMCDGVAVFRLLFGVSVRLDADTRTSVAEVPDFVSILIAE